MSHSVAGRSGQGARSPMLRREPSSSAPIMISGISGISAATSGLRSAFARFDRATAAVSENANLGSDATAAAGTGDLAGAIVDMLTAQLGVRASLEAVRGANDMLAEAIDLGGYTPRD